MFFFRVLSIFFFFFIRFVCFWISNQCLQRINYSSFVWFMCVHVAKRAKIMFYLVIWIHVGLFLFYAKKQHLNWMLALLHCISHTLFVSCVELYWILKTRLHTKWWNNKRLSYEMCASKRLDGIDQDTILWTTAKKPIFFSFKNEEKKYRKCRDGFRCSFVMLVCGWMDYLSFFNDSTISPLNLIFGWFFSSRISFEIVSILESTEKNNQQNSIFVQRLVI